MEKLKTFFSKNAKNMRSSEIRELLKLLDKPEMISFAGGLPNPDVFPIENIRRIVDHTMDFHAHEALQYGATEGHNKLREAIAKGMDTQYGVKSQTINNILITSGSQQALSLLAQLFINPKDRIVLENPSYLGAILAFRSFSAKFKTVDMDEQGIRTDHLRSKLKSLVKKHCPPKFIYLIPNCQNPTGISMTLKRRKEVYQIASEYDFYIIEDDPYGLISFDKKKLPLIKSLDTEGRVIYLSTFSKILAPGFRIAWVNASEKIINKMTIAKQAQDLCSNNFGQYCIFEAMYNDILFPQIDKIREVYRQKRDLMLESIEKYFPKVVKYTRPNGGLFIWVTLPAGINTFNMLPNAIESKVAYVPGESFYANGGGENTLRLNYSYAFDENIVEGIKRLGAVIDETLKKAGQKSEPDKVNIF